MDDLPDPEANAPVTVIRNIGPAFAEGLARAGITTAGALRSLGADAAYVRLLHAGSKPHFIGYYVLHMALQGRPWNDCKGAEKAALRKRFDQLVAQNLGDNALERQLDAIGLGLRR
ncbi:MAG: TfoX/Sxy family protein [Pseudomonadota bacterium]